MFNTNFIVYIQAMKNKAELNRQEIFEHALGEARNIAAQDGLSGLTARQIAKRIGCSVGTVYNVFENLDFLILHLNGRTLDALYEALSEVAPGDEPRQAVHALIKRYLEFVQAHTNLWSVLFDHIWPKDTELPDWYILKVQHPLGLLEAALTPLFSPDAKAECHRAAAVLWGGLHGLCSLAMTGKLGTVIEGGLDEMAGLLIDNFIAGLERGAPDS